MFECNFCKKSFSSKYNLTRHQKTTMTCIKLQTNKEDIVHVNFTCEFCDKKYTQKSKLSIHNKTCKKKEETIYKLTQELKNVKK